VDFKPDDGLEGMSVVRHKGQETRVGVRDEIDVAENEMAENEMAENEMAENEMAENEMAENEMAENYEDDADDFIGLRL
jgi:hypothetical protein